MRFFYEGFLSMKEELDYDSFPFPFRARSCMDDLSLRSLPRFIFQGVLKAIFSIQQKAFSVNPKSMGPLV